MTHEPHPDDKSSPEASLVGSLKSENATLKLRVAQLEESLHAIRGDEVDGLVLAGPQGERLFILDGADRVYRQLIEEMAEGAVTLSADGIVLYANKAFAHMVNRPLNALISSPVQSCFAPEAHQGLKDMLNGAAHGRQSSELDLVSSRNLRLAVLVSVGPLNLPDVPGALCMVVTDLTEKKRTQAEIEAREVLINLVKRQQITQNELTLSLETLQLRDNALACISQGVLIADSQRRTTYVNAAFEAITGYSCADMRGKSCAILQGIDTNPQTVRNLAQALNEKQPVSVELLNYRKDGTAFWNELSITPVFDVAGTLTQFVSVQRDVTNRRETQAQLALAAKMFEQGNEAFVIMDAQRTMLKVNPAFRAITGFTEADVLGQPFDILHSDQTDNVHYQSKRLAIEERGLWQGEIFKRFKDGSSHPQWLFMTRLLDESGATCNYIASFMDITERKRTEVDLRQALRDKDALIKEIHHRVKNNLQVITSLLRLEAGRSLVTDTKDVLGYMRGRIRAMAQLHESLYRSATFASVDLGVYLGQVATQAFKTQELHRGSVRLTLNLGSVQSDMDQAQAAGLLLNELVSNCLKHGFPEGRTGEVCVELQPAHDQDSPPDGRWCLRVSDTGVGLAPDFEDKRKTSLGLQLVTDLSHQLGGTLVIDSVPGAGARFQLVFPVETPAALVMPP